MRMWEKVKSRPWLELSWERQLCHQNRKERAKVGLAIGWLKDLADFEMVLGGYHLFSLWSSRKSFVERWEVERVWLEIVMVEVLGQVHWGAEDCQSVWRWWVWTKRSLKRLKSLLSISPPRLDSWGHNSFCVTSTQDSSWHKGVIHNCNLTSIRYDRYLNCLTINKQNARLF